MQTVLSESTPKVLPTKRDQKLLNGGVLISTEPPAGHDMAFMHAILCQVGLPRSRVDGREFLRQSGDAWVNIQAGVLDEGRGPVLQPIPYGAMPRLALAWITTFAIRNNTRVVPIGDSAADFLRMLGQSATGGERGTYTTLRKQMHALAVCRLQLGFKGRTYNGQPVEEFETWFPPNHENQRAIWPGLITLSSSFHGEIMEYGVPLDNRAMMQIKGSSLALDIYCWLAHRLHRIDGRPVFLPWKVLRDQFGQEYVGKNSNKDFKRTFLHALNLVMVVYPLASVKVVNCGIKLQRSPPPIAYKN